MFDRRKIIEAKATAITVIFTYTFKNKYKTQAIIAAIAVISAGIFADYSSAPKSGKTFEYNFCSALVPVPCVVKITM